MHFFLAPYRRRSSRSRSSSNQLIGDCNVCRPMSLLGLFENGDPQAPAIIVGSGGPTYTRSQIHAGALEFARFLRSKNVHTGDVVTIAESNKPQFIIAFLGITYARAVAAPLNQNFTKVSERNHFSNFSPPVKLILFPLLTTG